MKRVLSLLKKIVPSVLQIVVVAALLLTFIIAYNLGAGSKSSDDETTSSKSTTRQPTSRPANSNPVDVNGDGEIYTCSMHPQIKQDEPGDCPICGMELVEVEVEETDKADEVNHTDHASISEPDILGYACAMNCVPPLEEPGDCPICGMEMQPVVEDRAEGPIDGDPKRRLTMSEEAKALASIQTSPVVSNIPRKTIRLVGQLEISEDTVAHISADVGGRIDNLAAEYEGDLVEQGEELVLLYSPELLAVQQEFLQARVSQERLSSSSLETVRRSSESAVEAARERLRLAGMSPDEIDAIAKSGKAREQVTLNAPIGGTVVERHVEEGAYVKEGERILTIANLDTLWAEIAAYESDLPWLKVGQPVTFISEAFPGKHFTGKVSWINPITDVRTRTTSVRLVVDNKQGTLRPGMYLTANIESTLGDKPKLIIPESAPLITGERAVVYLMVPDTNRPTYQGVEVVLGPRVEDGYVVEEGLIEGQYVVTNGAFQIDSALQIVAKPSMMNPGGGAAMTGHEGHGSTSNNEVQKSSSSSASEYEAHKDSDIPLDELLTGYLHIQRALAKDDIEHAKHGWLELRQASSQLNDTLQEASSLGNADDIREEFDRLSQHVIAQVQSQPDQVHRELRLVHCPMAFDFSGADWLQAEEEIRNPYFGAEMLTCGTVEREWPAHD